MFSLNGTYIVSKREWVLSMNEEAEKSTSFIDYDYLSSNPHLQMIKAVIPYMPLQTQRTISMFIKFQELQRMRTAFPNGDLSAMNLSRPPAQNTSVVEILQVVKPYANPREREMIEMIENFQIMMQVMQTPT